MTYHDIVVECRYISSKKKIKVVVVEGQGIDVLYVQFPTALRQEGRRFRCSVTDAGSFYRSVKSTIQAFSSIPLYEINKRVRFLIDDRVGYGTIDDIDTRGPSATYQLRALNFLDNRPVPHNCYRVPESYIDGGME